MYKKAIEYYSPLDKKSINYSQYIGPKQYNQNYERYNSSTINQKYGNPSHRPLGNYSQKRINQTFPKDTPLNAHWNTYGKGKMQSPELWGPAFWFSLHNGAVHYPIKASRNHKERMKNFILAIPVMIPCVDCKSHAANFLEMNKGKLDNICQGRDKLFNFFVDFHNVVNRRLGKKIMSYEQAYALYNDGKAPYLSYN
jgi:hypothetical protein